MKTNENKQDFIKLYNKRNEAWLCQIIPLEDMHEQSFQTIWDCNPFLFILQSQFSKQLLWDSWKSLTFATKIQ